MDKFIRDKFGYEATKAQKEFGKVKRYNFAVQAPCGSGKSLMAIYAAFKMLESPNIDRVFISTYTNDLSKQYSEDLIKAGISHLRVMGKDNYPCACLYDYPTSELLEKNAYIKILTKRGLDEKTARERWKRVSALNMPSLYWLDIWHKCIGISRTDIKLAWKQLRADNIKGICKEDLAETLEKVDKLEGYYGVSFLEELYGNINNEPFYINFRQRRDSKLIITNHSYSMCFIFDDSIGFVFDECHKLVTVKRDRMACKLMYDAFNRKSAELVKSILEDNSIDGETKYKRLVKGEKADDLSEDTHSALVNLKANEEYKLKDDYALWGKVTMPEAESSLKASMPGKWLMLSATPGIGWIKVKKYGDDPMLNLTWANQKGVEYFKGLKFNDIQELKINREHIKHELWKPFLEDAKSKGMGLVLETSYNYFWNYSQKFAIDDNIVIIEKHRGVEVDEVLDRIHQALNQNKTPILITVSVEGLNINIKGISKAALIPAMSLPYKGGDDKRIELYGPKYCPEYHRDKATILEQQLGRINRNLDNRGSLWWGEYTDDLLLKVAPHLYTVQSEANFDSLGLF